MRSNSAKHPFGKNNLTIETDYSSYLNWKSIISFSGLNYLQAGVSFAISMLIAIQLGKEQFGYYTYGLIFLSSLMTLASFGMDKSLVRDLVQLNQNKQQFLLSATIFKLVLAIGLVAVVIGWTLLSFDDRTKQLVVVICTLVAIVISISPQQWYDYTGRLHRHALISLGERLACLVAVGGVVFFVESQPVVWIVALLLGTKLTMLLVEWYGVREELLVHVDKLTQQFRKIIINNVWIWFAAIGNMLMLQFNQFLLEDAYGLGQLALFGLAFQMVQLVILLQGQILRLASPKIAEVTKDFERRTVSRQLILTSLIVLGATIALVLPFYFLAPYFILDVVGIDFGEAIPVFNILLIWVMFYGVALINNQFLISLHLQRQYFAICVIFGLLSVVLSYYLVGLYGAVGAALSLLIAHSCSIIVQMILVWRFLYARDQILPKY